VNPSRWRDVNSLFHTLLDHTAQDHERLLADVEARDPELAQEVRSLLKSHDGSGAFLDAPVWEAAPELILDDGQSLVGRQIGPYRVIEEIGRGGMGVVYAAQDERLDRMVALKALPAAYTSDPVRRARLTREARAAAALSHPSIATIFALEETDDALCIVSELVRGRTLREELRDGPLQPRPLIAALIDIASALEAAHSLSIVHRDLKPENVIRRSDGQIKVLDFGLARWESQPDSPSMTRLTEAGVALGTPGYMAPEQLSGGEADARADIFSFGVLAWELATGEHPFGTDHGAVLTRMAGLMEGRAALPGNGPPGLDRIVLRCLRASPSDRYPSASALLEDLRALQSSSGDAAAQPVTIAAPSPLSAVWTIDLPDRAGTCHHWRRPAAEPAVHVASSRVDARFPPRAALSVGRRGGRSPRRRPPRVGARARHRVGRDGGAAALGGTDSRSVAGDHRAGHDGRGRLESGRRTKMGQSSLTRSLGGGEEGGTGLEELNE
jgi:eukaryotic-like serine/threonine-protein kinase